MGLPGAWGIVVFEIYRNSSHENIDNRINFLISLLNMCLLSARHTFYYQVWILYIRNRK